MIKIDLQPEIENRLAEQAQARGQTFSDYLRDLLVKQAKLPAEHGEHPSPAEAVRSIRQLRKGNTLRGFNIQDFIHEGRKY